MVATHTDFSCFIEPPYLGTESTTASSVVIPSSLTQEVAGSDNAF